MMDNILLAGIGAIAGIIVGVLIGKSLGGKSGVGAGPAEAEKDWWDIRKNLTGTQLQILQYMEAHKSATIAVLQEKFSFIPDRELYYRLEQIVLLGFIHRGRQDGDVSYELNPEYDGTVEDDKTVMLD
ncbi:MAG: hypothetical protein KDI36_06410 [Pseudomonadales bacterium]|nr:hypothetical protein [Pseudomonadales bacterium]